MSSHPPSETRPTRYFLNPKDGTEMVLVPGGWFWMGSGDEDPEKSGDETPRHLHRVAPFYMALECVTVKRFAAFVKEARYEGGKYPGTGSGYSERWGEWRKDPEDHPVRYVNWFDARAYCDWAGLRLPTEAEWELAARGYEALKYPWGNNWKAGKRVCWDKRKGPGGATAPVFSHPGGAGPFGTFQQSGNLWEWCEDWYDGEAYNRYARGDFSPPGSGTGRVLRGGSWYLNYPKYFRGAYRFDIFPEYRTTYYGFRGARTVTL